MSANAAVLYESTSSTRERCILDHIHIVKIIAFQEAIRLPSYAHMDIDDLISVGTMGLMNAVDKFDVSRKVLFKTYASVRIRGAIKDELRKLDFMTRSMRDKSKQLIKASESIERSTGRPAEDEELARVLNKTTDELYELMSEVGGLRLYSLDGLNKDYDDKRSMFDLIENPDAEDPVNVVGTKELKQRVVKILGTLPKTDRLVVSLYYYDELTLRDVGKVLGVTESRVCQLLSGILRTLATRLKRYNRGLW